MDYFWVCLCYFLFPLGEKKLQTTVRCDCNGRSRYCLRDAWGLHCLDCQGNYEGRHCERCKDGFYEEEVGPSCSPCHCNPTGSVSATCDNRGRCSCKEGVTGEKCDRCPDGPIGPNGCSQSLTLPCFCSGHSNICSPQSGYSVHNIISTFADGPEGWKAATVNGFTPDDVHFRWSPKHQDLEVISRNSLPVYLYAPEPYLGNQLLSYGQNLSFSLRLDRGVRHPSTNDVVLEGDGLRVAASLGDLRSIVPCGQKIKYSFRLDEQPDSRWRPQISSFQFQKLLQNLTAIKIRTTFGETGRGYLDNVQLVSARPSDGVPARWVQACSCPPGYDGLFCERCAAGFRRRSPAEGAFGRCERCSCTGGSCDPQTGDCYSADETPAERSCSEGFYRDPWNLDRCVKCPCPDGLSCSVPAGSLEPRCDRCPPGTTGPRCDSCQEGFHGDPAGVAGVQRPCRPCSCNGHIDVSVAGSCDRITGECLKCVNNTRGQSCEFCERGFYHSRPSDACKSCNCDFRGSESDQCDDSGRCQCRSGFEGLRCQRSNCPACFGPIKVKVRLWFSRFSGDIFCPFEDSLHLFHAVFHLFEDIFLSLFVVFQMEAYATKVKELETLFSDMDGGLKPANNAEIELPLSDAPLGSDALSTLVQTAKDLADKHETKANAVEKTANEALSDSNKGLALVRTLMNKENKVKELIGDLKRMYDQTSAQVKGLEDQATRLSGEAKDESKMAAGMLKDITSMERNIPSPMKVTTAVGLTSTFDLCLQELGKLVNRVNAAKDVTEDALQRINGNTNDLDNALNALRGFDRQIDGSKALADAAISRLPGINGTIQQAVRNNAETLSTLGNVSKDYNGALGAINMLDTLVNNLEVKHSTGSLPPHADLAKRATKLNGGAKDLKLKVDGAARELASELDGARRLEKDADKVNCPHIDDLLEKRFMNKGGQQLNNTVVVDEEDLKRLEDSLANAQRNVEGNLRPRLRDMEEKEEAQRRRLTGINQDIDTILADIANLEDILRAVPRGCYNSPPIEEA
uniref:Laminin subunit gamma 2 n=1 Tax=Amphiprion percula TaxID=161767 RepID=A0A3P8S9W4_AMPPE